METAKKEAIVIFREYYEHKKPVLEIIGFIGVIAGLFLQATQFQNQDLKIIQAFLLSLFCLSLIYLFFDFWLNFTLNYRETSINIAVNNLFFSLILFVFTFHVVRFLYSVYKPELISIFRSIQYPLALIVFYLISKVLRKYIKIEKLFFLFDEVLYFTLTYFVFFFPFSQNRNFRTVLLVGLPTISMGMIFKLNLIQKKRWIIYFFGVVILAVVLNFLISK